MDSIVGVVFTLGLTVVSLVVLVQVLLDLRATLHEKTDYDERQLQDLEHGRSISWFVLLAGLVVGILLYSFGIGGGMGLGRILPAGTFLTLLLLVGVAIDIIYAIWTHSYFGIPGVSHRWINSTIGLGVVSLGNAVLDVACTGWASLAPTNGFKFILMNGFKDVTLGIFWLLIGITALMRRMRDCHEDALAGNGSDDLCPTSVCVRPGGEKAGRRRASRKRWVSRAKR